MNWSLDRKFIIGFGAVLATLAVFGLVSYWSLNQVLETGDQVRKTYEVLQVTGNLLSHVKDIETEKRDFIITGDERHLMGYHAVKPRIREELKYLNTLTIYNLNQHLRLKILEPLIDEKMAISDQAIELRRAEGFEAARSLLLTDQGEQVMEDIRRQVDEIEGEERTLLAQRYARQNTSVLVDYLVITLGGFLAFLFVSFVSILIHRDIDQRKRSARLLAAQYAVTRVLAESETLDKASPKILQAICESLDWKMGGIWRVDKTAGTLRCVELWHIPTVNITEFMQISRSRTFNFGVGLPGRIWASRQPAWIPDVVKDPNFPRGPYAARAGLHTAFGFPILIGEEVLGVVEFFSNRILRPDESLLKVMYVAGGQIGQYLVRKEAEAKEREALNIKSEFTSMVSHELRTPLTVIKESVGIVEDGSVGAINAEQRDFLETARRNVDRLARLINSVLDYQKLEAGHMEFKMTPNDINAVIRESQQGFELFAKTKGLHLEMKLAEGLPPVLFDKDKIMQVLLNLMNNAVKFTEKGSIRIETSKEGDEAVRVSVADQGIGIKKEDMAKLFVSFSQISSGSTRKTGGTGLGLAISKRIVENHQGQMGVESVFGHGSTFYFILPISKGQ